jgi:hypothetical protein
MRRSVHLVVLSLSDQVSDLQEDNPGSTECRIAWAADAQLDAISPLIAHSTGRARPQRQLGCVLCLLHGAINLPSLRIQIALRATQCSPPFGTCLQKCCTLLSEVSPASMRPMQARNVGWRRKLVCQGAANRSAIARKIVPLRQDSFPGTIG